MHGRFSWEIMLAYLSVTYAGMASEDWRLHASHDDLVRNVAIVFLGGGVSALLTLVRRRRERTQAVQP